MVGEWRGRRNENRGHLVEMCAEREERYSIWYICDEYILSAQEHT